MKQFLIVLALLVAASGTAVASGSSSAFIAALGKSVVEILEDPNLSQDERAARYGDRFRQAFDWDRIGAFAIGQYRRGVTRQKFEEYRDLFAAHMMQIYAAKFAGYSGEQFVIKGERAFGRGGSEVVALLRGADSGEAVKLAFKLVQEDGTQRIYDVAVNGVSLLVAKRAEVKGIIASGGIDGLIAQLRKANAR